GVRLVVAKLHVEWRVKLFDPAEFELQGLELAADFGPFNACGGRDHAPRALVQARERSEIVAQPCAQALRLADVENSTGGIPKPVNTGSGRYLPWFGSVADGVGHVRPSVPHART